MGTVLTEVPTGLKRLVRLVIRGFYNIEHAILMDMLIRNPCMKEDDLVELLKLERKQLRAVIAQLKNDRFVKVRLRMETGQDGKATRQNYYYINYKIFVNVLKYKLDHMRRKIETEERDSTSRASFRCPACCKTFTDLEADQLCDFATGEFRCSFCAEPVEESAACLSTEHRLDMARFNEQIEPLYSLLREVDDVKLAPELLEPEPTDVSQIRRDASGAKASSRPPGVWSGDATRNKSYDQASITVSVSGNESTAQAPEKKEQPVWMVESTVRAEAQEVSGAWGGETKSQPDLSAASVRQPDMDIMEALLAHERKADSGRIVIPGHNDETSSGSEENSRPFVEQDTTAVEMEDESGDEEEISVRVADRKYPLSEVTEELVAQMTPEEKEAYIRITQDLYASIYD